MKKYKESGSVKLQKAISKLQSRCVTAVNQQLNKTIPLGKNDVLRIVRAIKRFSPAKDLVGHDTSEYRRYIDELRGHYKALKQSGQDFQMIRLSPRLQWVAMMALESTGKEKFDFELMRLIIRWYGIERSRMKVFKEFIPQDTREGAYDNDNYDGPAPFVLDNVGMTYEDEQAMQSAIEYNKWSKNNLIPA
jgi:hypothetical protein